MKLSFTKMHGCGNDYIYFNCLEEEIPHPEKLSKILSHRRFSIGGDGIVLICPSEKGDAFMRMFNADGSEGKMCGNAIRCVGKYLYDKGRVKKETLKIETLSGLKTLDLSIKDGEVDSVLVDMGPAVLDTKRIPAVFPKEQIIGEEILVAGREWQISCVSMGNPHCVTFVSDLSDLPIEVLGPEFEHHPMFPERVNTEFVQIIDQNTLSMRVWERGSGETWACGTGACASVVAACENGFCKKNEEILVHLKGGDLIIRYAEEGVYMTGSAQIAFSGSVSVSRKDFDL